MTNLADDELIVSRPGSSLDLDFIYSSWIRSYRIADAVRTVTSDNYWDGQNKLITHLLKIADITVLCSSEDQDTIIAWMVSSNSWIHYIYTKQAFRKMALAKRLVGEQSRWLGYTQETPVVRKLRPDGWKYDPFQVWLSSV